MRGQPPSVSAKALEASSEGALKGSSWLATLPEAQTGKARESTQPGHLSRLRVRCACACGPRRARAPQQAVSVRADSSARPTLPLRAEPGLTRAREHAARASQSTARALRTAQGARAKAG